MSKNLRITAKVARRRAGLHWPKGSTTVVADSLTKEQLKALAEDPNFTVEETTGEPTGTTAKDLEKEDELAKALKEIEELKGEISSVKASAKTYMELEENAKAEIVELKKALEEEKESHRKSLTTRDQGAEDTAKKLDEAVKYAEAADKKIADLEEQLKAAKKAKAK